MPITRSFKSIHKVRTDRQGALVPAPEVTGGKLGVQTLDDLFQVVLTPARVFTPTESIKLTWVKSRMTV